MLLRVFLAWAFIFAVSFAHAYDNGQVPINTPESAMRMLTDMIATFGDNYPAGPEYMRKLEDVLARLKKNGRDPDTRREFESLRKEIALSNPLLDCDKILLIRRDTTKGGWGFLRLNSHTNHGIRRDNWDTELVVMSEIRKRPRLTPIYRHPNAAIMRDLDMHFDGQRFLFSSINAQGNWAVFEVGIDGKNCRELTPSDQPDVDWFDACYLPEEGVIIAASTAGMQGLPCENGGQPMVNLYRVECGTPDAPLAEKKVRQLTFEQDSDWHPSVMNDGRVMYLRWEYSDIPHYTSRMLFAMQPDGRQQRAVWGSGSYFPTAFKSPRAIPDSSMILGVVSGHHTHGGGIPETGRLMLLNPQLGSKYPFRYDPTSKEWGKPLEYINLFPRVYPKEVTGCVQEIPGYERDVVGNVLDNQGGMGKYRFAYPFPLNENYYLVNIRVDGKGTFGLWLVDRFDNMTKIHEMRDDSVFQPILVQPRKRPPVRMDMTDTQNPQGTMFITDVYQGGGLHGVPRGTAKTLRIFAYHFGFQKSGGHESVGQVSCWDIKRVLGTVPIEEDGSAMFHVPANTPLSIQVLDEEGRALQLMRSWTISMPGEHQSCIGCHETPLEATPSKQTIAGNKPPRDITPWYGPARPFSYETEIQPMLEKNCVACHHDETKKELGLLSFEAHQAGNWRTDTSYASLNPYIWRPGPEPDLEMLVPLDYHASVSELVQMLKKGHHGVRLDREAWDRLYTWIDLNVPYRGGWNNPEQEKRRQELYALYAFLDTNPEAEFRAALDKVEKTEIPKKSPAEVREIMQAEVAADDLAVPAWPFDAPTAVAMQRTNEKMQNTMVVDIGDAQRISFVRIPAGTYIMGQRDGAPDVRKRKIVTIPKDFWMADTEITNGQYGVYDPDHDTRYLREDGKDHTTPGYIANHPQQPVARISFQDAEAFCEWLSEKCGKTVKLPTESQWEWAARAGSETPFWYGDRDTDFSPYANLAGAEVRETATGYESGSVIHKRRMYPADSLFPLRDDRFTDKWFVVDYVKQYQPNPWGLYDIIGNVWEWTAAEPGSEENGMVVARGGSWKDRPSVSGASARVVYAPWQKVMNVGFRPIIVEECRAK